MGIHEDILSLSCKKGKLTKKEKDKLRKATELRDSVRQPQPLMKKAILAADYLYKHYRTEDKDGRDCGKLFLEWTKENFWGRIVEDNLKHFDSLYENLKANKHTRRNKYIYGDYDYGVWIEPSKTKHRKVIVATCYCACRDDNTTIYIKDEISPDWIRFRVDTVWGRQKKNKFNFGDDRDIDTPSLVTYRKRDFEYGYRDSRDKGHVLKYDSLHSKHGRVENAHANETGIYWALWSLKNHAGNLRYDLTNPE
jgi:hypothetical protein